VPKTVKVTIKRRKYTVKVTAAKTLAGGKRLNVGLQLPRAAYSWLKGRTASVTVKVTATAAGTSATTLTVKATIRRWCRPSGASRLDRLVPVAAP
jgi:hypothetical protein